MKQTQSKRRGRGRSNVRGGGKRNQNGGGAGNRASNRSGGNAKQQLEKYRNMARDATQIGDNVMAEYYLQHVDHYQRILNERTEATQPSTPKPEKQDKAVKTRRPGPRQKAPDEAQAASQEAPDEAQAAPPEAGIATEEPTGPEGKKPAAKKGGRKKKVPSPSEIVEELAAAGDPAP